MPFEYVTFFHEYGVPSVLSAVDASTARSLSIDSLQRKLVNLFLANTFWTNQFLCFRFKLVETKTPGVGYKIKGAMRV